MFFFFFGKKKELSVCEIVVNQVIAWYIVYPPVQLATWDMIESERVV